MSSPEDSIFAEVICSHVIILSSVDSCFSNKRFICAQNKLFSVTSFSFLVLLTVPLVSSSFFKLNRIPLMKKFEKYWPQGNLKKKKTNLVSP
jgi:hypothetical protein